MTEPFFTGDTFSYVVPFTVKVNEVEVTDLTGWQARSQLRSDCGELIAELNVEWLSYSPAVLALTYVGNTQSWPVGSARLDVEFVDPDGNKKSSRAAIIPVEHDVTRPS